MGEALNSWCRESELLGHHLVQWRADFCAASGTGSRRENAQEVRVLKHARVQMQRELKRKEKALAEAAALLVLQKKYRALFEGEAQ
ncbi:hypothetical protein PQR11_33660 [Paraburkholderia strydomiana]|uniref:hypothetical protein n=1 Tax=Paraburkholderia strydomiana TaxID=1245417 RepID=UPI0038BAD129